MSSIRFNGLANQNKVLDTLGSTNRHNLARLLGGYSYVSKLTDYPTRLTAVYFIANKTGALQSFVKFWVRCGYPLGLRAHRLDSDNGKGMSIRPKRCGLGSTYSLPVSE